MKEAIEIEREVFSEEDYISLLNDSGPVNVCGYPMDPAYILQRLDPIAFRCGFNDMQEYETAYQCPICEETYDEEEDAKYCCQEYEES